MPKRLRAAQAAREFPSLRPSNSKVDLGHESRRSGRDGETKDVAGETILVAEDEEMVRGLLARMLRLRGYEVIEAASGGEAVAAAARGDRIDLLITDVVMTDMNGRELADRLA